MNIDNDYLWDKTGEPDPQVQQLEETLGRLRYQPLPLRIPAKLQVGRERSFFRGSAQRLAIAATLAILLLGLGLWLGLQRWQRNRQTEIAGAANTPQQVSGPASTTNNNSDTSSASAPGHEVVAAPKDNRVNEPLPYEIVSRHERLAHDARIKRQLLAIKRRHEAEAAKDQLMLALRLASAKLNFAQRKTLNSKDEIHNQHKIG